MHNPSNPKYSVLVADDHKIFRDGMVETLKQIRSVSYVKQAANGIEVLEQLKEKECNIIFMDVNMPGKNGEVTTREVTRSHPNVKVIALTMFDDQSHVIDMLEAGACGYLLKSTDKKEIADAIDTIMAGNRFYGKDISKVLVENSLENLGIVKDRSTGKQLQPKEIEILKLIYSELDTKEIAAQLNMSSRTLERYRLKLFDSTGTHNIAGLIKYAIKYDYVLEAKG